MSMELNKEVFGTKVLIAASNERGVIRGYAQNERDNQPQFLVEYVAADGRFAAHWFYQDQLIERT